MKFHKTLRISITVRRHFGKVFAILIIRKARYNCPLLTKSCSEFYGYNVKLQFLYDIDNFYHF